MQQALFNTLQKVRKTLRDSWTSLLTDYQHVYISLAKCQSSCDKLEYSNKVKAEGLNMKVYTGVDKSISYTKPSKTSNGFPGNLIDYARLW